jgi:hypothetical protein
LGGNKFSRDSVLLPHNIPVSRLPEFEFNSDITHTGHALALVVVLYEVTRRVPDGRTKNYKKTKEKEAKGVGDTN